MLNLVRPEVFGTVECICAAEKSRMLPTGPTTRICGSSSIGSSGFGCFRVSTPICCAAICRLVRFHS